MTFPRHFPILQKATIRRWDGVAEGIDAGCWIWRTPTVGPLPSALLGISSAPQVDRSRLVRSLISLSDSDIRSLGSLLELEEPLVAGFGVVMVRWRCSE